jgi:hypothetical protein
MKRVRTRVKELTDSRSNGVKDVDALIRDLNPVLRGSGNYFRTGHAARKFLSLDKYVVRRLNDFGGSATGGMRSPDSESAGTVRNMRPEVCTACAAPSATPSRAAQRQA